MDRTQTEAEITNELYNRFLPVDGEIPATDGRRAPRKSRPQEKESKIEPLLSIVEAAKSCGVSRHRIDAAINSGELAFYPIGEKARKVKASDLMKWIESKRTRIGGYYD